MNPTSCAPCDPSIRAPAEVNQLGVLKIWFIHNYSLRHRLSEFVQPRSRKMLGNLLANILERFKVSAVTATNDSTKTQDRTQIPLRMGDHEAGRLPGRRLPRRVDLRLQEFLRQGQPEGFLHHPQDRLRDLLDLPHEMTTALDKITVGDSLILNKGGWYCGRSVVTVTKTTPTQIHVGALRFRRSNGRRVGDSDWRSPSIQVPIDGEIQEVMDENEKAMLCRELDEMKWYTLTLETLRSIKAVILSNETPAQS